MTIVYAPPATSDLLPRMSLSGLKQNLLTFEQLRIITQTFFFLNPLTTEIV